MSVLCTKTQKMNSKSPNHRFLFCLYLLLAGFVAPAGAQEIPAYNPILSDMGELESRRDAKCHATASRLEDFIYGTPLSFEARSARIDFQQKLVESIWTQYTSTWNSNGRQQNQQAFQDVLDQHLSYQKTDAGVRVTLTNGTQITIPARDFRQYSSIAYAYRAILAVQQSCTLEASELAPIEGAMLDQFKEAIDIAVLGLLSQADKLARTDNSTKIEARHITTAAANWKLNPVDLASDAQVDETQRAPANFIYPVIAQKLAAYQAYNDINQKVFLRNIQVYFTKVPWPSEQAESDAVKNYFNEFMVAFTRETLLLAQKMAAEKQARTIRYQDMYMAVQEYLPHSVNSFEDVLYFPRLAPPAKIAIQAYDLDAFRDSGLHWQYLKFAIDDMARYMELAPDPFALEMLVEGTAQFAVLIFRMAGAKAKAQEAPHLTINHLDLALRDFQSYLQQYSDLPPANDEAIQLASAPETTKAKSGTLFRERTGPLGISFQHRNSDWLSRLIRGYVVKEDENLVRLSIPPAFGGGGVAAEDIDGDGWTDILLLGGEGCALLQNQHGKAFVDKTQRAGINWKREDGTYPEARQPLVVDLDNDGDQDIVIIYANDKHRVFENLGDWKFRDQTNKAQLGGEGLIGGPTTVIDFDQDGLLDIYIGYFGNYLNGELPTLRRHNTNGSPNKLFRNLGGFRFEDVSAGSGVENTGWTQAVGHTDINGDGWQDLIAGNDFGTNSYYINNQDGTFTDVSSTIGTDKPSYTMNVGIADINEDLRPDFYISNIVVMEKDDKYVLPNEDTQAHFDPKSLASMRVVEANDLFVSQLNANSPVPTFSASAKVGRGYSATGWSWDADFFDFDNDTDLDLYCLTGMNQYSVYSAENPYYTSPDGTPLDITLAQSLAEKNILFENKDGALNVVETDSGIDYEGTSRSAAYLDYDQDGDLDIIVNEYQGAARLFENTANNTEANWMMVHLEGKPGKGNRDAIGAQLILKLPDGRKLWREVHSTDGYLSVHPKTLHFGLGKATTADLEIVWPNGDRDRHLELKSNTIHHFTQN